MQDGQLKASAKSVRLSAVEFLVRDSGRQKMLRERRKIVHAYAEGLLVDFTHPSEARELDALEGRGVYYNAYEAGTFLDVDSAEPVMKAEFVQFCTRGGVYSPESAAHDAANDANVEPVSDGLPEAA